MSAVLTRRGSSYGVVSGTQRISLCQVGWIIGGHDWMRGHGRASSSSYASSSSLASPPHTVDSIMPTGIPDAIPRAETTPRDPGGVLKG